MDIYVLCEMYYGSNKNHFISSSFLFSVTYVVRSLFFLHTSIAFNMSDRENTI